MDTQQFRNAYASLLKAYVEGQQEQYLEQAGTLGRELVLADVPPEEIAEIHEQALQYLATEFPDRTLLESATLISAPLMELLMAYGLAFRGQREERRKVFEALRLSEEKYRSIFQVAASMITTVNRHGIIVDCNQRIEELLGYQRDQIIGRPSPVLSALRMKRRLRSWWMKS